MPSKRTIVLIILFWLLTTGYVAYRDLWPRLFASGPPPVAIDLVDEAAQTIAPVNWSIYRGDQKIGKLVSRVRYVATDDTFRFENEYKQLELEVSAVKCVIPELTTTVRVTRGGDLREQSLDGKMEGYLFGIRFADAKAHIHGLVNDGQLNATCEIQSNLGDFKQALDPIPITKGQPLNPLQPVNRLNYVKPGLSWFVEMSSPLEDATGMLVRKKLEEQGLKLADKKREPLFARVLSEQQDLNWHNQIVACWVIEYKQDSEPVARTWVRIADGKVLKQEAFRGGEQLTIVREEY